MIRPTAFSGSGIDVWHDERGHGGTLAWNDLTLHWPERMLIVPCPVAGCNSASCWPVGGGGDADAGQRLFLHMLKRATPNRTWAQAKAIARVAVRAAEGPDRWRMEDAQENDPVVSVPIPAMLKPVEEFDVGVGRPAARGRKRRRS